MDEFDAKLLVGLTVNGSDDTNGNNGVHRSSANNVNSAHVQQRHTDNNGEQELATKVLHIQSKRFYLDVKQNRRGRFMKIAEIGADGRRNQIFLALSTASEFRENLTAFADFYAALGPPKNDHPTAHAGDGKLKSELMFKDNRRYYLDLKENARGRFLRVAQTIPRGGPRSQIAIPAQGMIEVRNALTDLLDEFGKCDGELNGDLPVCRHMKVDNKNFYFDIGQNNRGVYMRISEVNTLIRTAITVPEKSWSKFRDILNEYCESMKNTAANKLALAENGGSSSSLSESPHSPTNASSTMVGLLEDVDDNATAGLGPMGSALVGSILNDELLIQPIGSPGSD